MEGKDASHGGLDPPAVNARINVLFYAAVYSPFFSVLYESTE